MHIQTIITLFTQHAFWLDEIDPQNPMNTRLGFFLLLESYDGEVHQMTLFQTVIRKLVIAWQSICMNNTYKPNVLSCET